MVFGRIFAYFSGASLLHDKGVTRCKTGLMLPTHISAQMTYANFGLVASVAVLAVGAALSAHD